MGGDGVAGASGGPAAGLPHGAPPGALAGRLALHALVFGNARAVAALWLRFVRELRFAHWEPRERLPRMPRPPAPRPGAGPGAGPGSRAAALPDLCAGLLHQKLQLLDHCIAVLRDPGSAFEPPLPPLPLAPPAPVPATGLGLGPAAGGGADAQRGADARCPDDDGSASDYGTCSEGEAAPGLAPAADGQAGPDDEPAPRDGPLQEAHGHAARGGAGAAAAAEGAEPPPPAAQAAPPAALPRGVAGALFCFGARRGDAPVASGAALDLVAFAPVARAPEPLTSDALAERAAALAALGAAAPRPGPVARAQAAARPPARRAGPPPLAQRWRTPAARARPHGPATWPVGSSRSRPPCARRPALAVRVPRLRWASVASPTRHHSPGGEGRPAPDARALAALRRGRAARPSAHGVTGASARRAGGGAAARARVEGAAALSDARAFQAANPALGAGAAGLAAFRRWRAVAGRGGDAGDAPAEQVRSRPHAGGRDGAAPTSQDRPRIDAQAAARCPRGTCAPRASKPPCVAYRNVQVQACPADPLAAAAGGVGGGRGAGGGCGAAARGGGRAGGRRARAPLAGDTAACGRVGRAGAPCGRRGGRCPGALPRRRAAARRRRAGPVRAQWVPALAFLACVRRWAYVRCALERSRCRGHCERTPSRTRLRLSRAHAGAGARGEHCTWRLRVVAGVQRCHANGISGGVMRMCRSAQVGQCGLVAAGGSDSMQTGMPGCCPGCLCWAAVRRLSTLCQPAGLRPGRARRCRARTRPRPPWRAAQPRSSGPSARWSRARRCSRACPASLPWPRGCWPTRWGAAARLAAAALAAAAAEAAAASQGRA